ncbi:MAG: [Fe-Fe] hydrogenase large subunit C-terminal domain-containing protein [Monoglobales bacterium]
MSYFHSVTLDKNKCHGCTNCIKRCPTEAIRVRGGKAKIIKERCIDCGECIRVCPYHAKLANTDSLDSLSDYKYTVAMPAPSLYGQFKDVTDVNKILTALKLIGFDDVYEVARGAEIVSEATRRLIEKGGLVKPIINSACPAVLRLIRVRFPGLINHILPVSSPMEAAAMEARREAVLKTGLKNEEIGIFFITPCPAKETSIKSPLLKEKSNVNGAISIADIYMKIHNLIKNIDKPEMLAQAGLEGVSWARSGGECKATDTIINIAVDGIDEVIKILEEIENGKIDDIDFVELLACNGGCVGGPLTVENSYVCSNRIRNMIDLDPETKRIENIDEEGILWEKVLMPVQIMQLADNLEEAVEKLEQIDKIWETMPKLDCGSCGAPSCKALAEDIVKGFATENDCIFKMREKVQNLAKELFDLESSPHGSKSDREI